jgi:ribosomal protein L32
MGRRRAVRQKKTKSQRRRDKRRSHHAFGAPPSSKATAVVWDNHLTMKQNYKRLGLLADVNDVQPIRPQQSDETETEKKMRKRHDAVAAGILSEELDRIASLPEPEPYETRSMSIKEQQMIQKLIYKHDDDVSAMVRDIKVNVDQLTSAQLRKRIALYKKLQNL